MKAAANKQRIDNGNKETHTAGGQSDGTAIRAASCGDIEGFASLAKKLHPGADALDVDNSSTSELSTFATSSSSSYKPQEVTRHLFKPKRTPSDCSSSSSSSDVESDCISGTNCSMPESEAFWSELPAMRPLINPDRLQALRLCSRDRRVPDGGDATILASPASPQQQSLVAAVGDQQRQQLEQQLQQKLEQLDWLEQPSEASTWHSQQTLVESQMGTDRNQCNSRCHAAGISDRMQRTHCDEAAGGDHVSQSESNAAELKISESASRPPQAIYQYSFRVHETKANMRPFSDPTDRRVEAIARACDSEILLDPEPIRVAASTVRLRRVTIRAPDSHSLEKCCRMFDQKFPQFYVSGGLGPDGRGVSKVYDDTEEKYITASHDD